MQVLTHSFVQAGSQANLSHRSMIAKARCFAKLVLLVIGYWFVLERTLH